MQDKQSRKYFVTIENFLKHGYTRENIRQRLNEHKSLVYFCAAEEIGLNTGTHHIHIYIVFSSAVRFSTMKKMFSLGGHIEVARGTSSANRDYVAKEGKYEKDPKADTKIDGTFEEYGELPKEHQGIGNVEMDILERIKNGESDIEILSVYPHLLTKLSSLEYVRQKYFAAEFGNNWRHLETTYIFGPTGIGKTRYVMEKYGYSNVYATSITHPFDGYSGESVMLFDEFDSDNRVFSITDMNRYLDGYPLTLPARYSDKQAQYEHVYIISNLELSKQYSYEQTHKSELWNAFYRRIHKIIEFKADGTMVEIPKK